jgi:hypothetical protein
MNSATACRRHGDNCLETAKSLPRELSATMSEIAEAWFMLAAEHATGGPLNKMILPQQS